jgi:hypothetical protein
VAFAVVEEEVLSVVEEDFVAVEAVVVEVLVVVIDHLMQAPLMLW